MEWQDLALRVPHRKNHEKGEAIYRDNACEFSRTDEKA